MLTLSKIRNADLVSPDHAMFCTHLSHFGMLYNCYHERDFLLYVACGEHMLKTLLILTVLKIISVDINGNSNLIKEPYV